MSPRRPVPTPSRRTAATRRRPRLAGLATAPALALLVAGCSATNPILTQEDYDASDGLSVDVADVRAENLLVLSSGVGAPGTLVGAFTNDGDESTRITLVLSPDVDEAEAAAESAVAGTPAPEEDLEPSTPQEVTVDAGETVLLGTGDGPEVVFDSVPARPGAVVLVTIETGDGALVERLVPVLNGAAYPEYADLVPTATPSPLATPADDADATAEPTAEPTDEATAEPTDAATAEPED